VEGAKNAADLPRLPVEPPSSATSSWSSDNDLPLQQAVGVAPRQQAVGVASLMSMEDSLELVDYRDQGVLDIVQVLALCNYWCVRQH
jgi:hypothetical protein